MTIAEVAHVHGVHAKTIRRMIARGDLEAVRLGPRLIRVNRASLDASGGPYRALTGR
ncbi:helix-turn-helix domain-containing protein [Agromyces salentinus]|nr:helix-turn-helix domain-containing protein [Agromyces salentinus]